MADELPPRAAVLMVDIGGTHVKVKCSGMSPAERFDSGSAMTPTELVERVLSMSSFDHVEKLSIGYPGLVRLGQPAAEPGNLGNGWVGFDFAKAFQRPVRIINDAALQALAAYRGGRMLFVGLGTGAGGALVVDGLIAPIELGDMRLTRTNTLADRLSKDALEDLGIAIWKEHIHDALTLLKQVFNPDDLVLGGGNAELLDALPSGCRTFCNDDAYLGALRLWGYGGVNVIEQASSWRVEADWQGE